MTSWVVLSGTEPTAAVLAHMTTSLLVTVPVAMYAFTMHSWNLRISPLEPGSTLLPLPQQMEFARQACISAQHRVFRHWTQISEALGLQT
jgi:hypothetical protein